MRISDWSSDVCSSDLYFAAEARMVAPGGEARLVYVDPYRAVVTEARDRETIPATLRRIHRQFYLPNDLTFGDRKSVVSGKSVQVRVDLGGRRSIHITINNNNRTKESTAHSQNN